MKRPLHGPALHLQDFLPYRLSIAANAVSRVIAAAYEERFAISVPEWRLIAVLQSSGPSTQQDLVRLTLMDKVAVSRAAISLAKRDLINRRQDSADGRAWRLTLSRKGKALFERIAPLALEFESRLLDDFARDETETLKLMLDRLIHAAQAIASPSLALENGRD